MLVGALLLVIGLFYQSYAMEDECKDSTVVSFNGLSCADFVAEDPCNCDLTQFRVRKLCCASCKDAVCPPCRDYLSTSNSIEVTKPDETKEVLTDCSTLVTNYLSLCNKYGKEGQRCCESCSQQDLSCIDDSLKYYVVGGEHQACAEYVAGDPCRCEMGNVKKACCASCENAVCEPCRDYLSADQPIIISKPKETLTDCKDLIDKYLVMCTKKYGQEGGHCCKSCSEQDLDCIDNTLTKFVVGGQSMLCEEYVSQDPCVCERKKVQETCCASCQTAVCPACRDTLSGKNPIKIKRGKKVVSTLRDCSQLISRYLVLCKRHGGEGGLCCESCMDQNLTCVDNNLKFFKVGKASLKCAALIKWNMCMCEKANIMNDCCASCKDVDLDQCCQDSSKWTGTAKKGKLSCRKCTCTEIEDAGLMVAACKGNQSNIRKHCCETCTALGHPPK